MKNFINKKLIYSAIAIVLVIIGLLISRFFLQKTSEYNPLQSSFFKDSIVEKGGGPFFINAKFGFSSSNIMSKRRGAC